jgi:hypothetical protein
MSGHTIGAISAIALVAAAAFSTGWVLRDARARGIPPRKALTWAALQWVEFPLFRWLYRRIRPRGKRERQRGGTTLGSDRSAGLPTWRRHRTLSRTSVEMDETRRELRGSEPPFLSVRPVV